MIVRKQSKGGRGQTQEFIVQIVKKCLWEKVYQLAYQVAMEIFYLSKSFPKEEKYSLTDQVKRSSRSVCAHIAEGCRKKRYAKHFTLKVTDADGEANNLPPLLCPLLPAT